MQDIPRDRWQRIDNIFVEAMDLAADARETYLDRECRDDAELRAIVDALIRADSADDGRLPSSAAELAGPLAAAGAIGDEEADDSLRSGDRVGAWGILNEIGRGGMGAVYLAERADGTFDQRAALKLVKRGMDTDEVIRRFRHERQILASLEHPNIARLLDGGASPDGRPFIVMELVTGEPIGRHCDRVRLSVRERLELFTRVCEAVQYAHANLVVHRDLKPSNILVAADGSPKLLDFGVARLLDDSSRVDSPRTATGMRMLTPGYAAPEQIRGDPVTTAMDVYALGVVLHELLVGRRPFPTDRSNPFGQSEAENRAPDRPSVAVTDPKQGPDAASSVADARSTTPDRLARTLRGDIDTILLKAVAHDPARRYSSVQELAADISRHLKGLPVSAQPDSGWYRSKKFIRRNRVAVGAASAFAVTLVAFAVAMRVEQRETAIERDRAQLERDKAEQVVEFMTGMLAAADPAQARGDTLNIFQVLSRSEQRLDSALAGQPEVRARMFHVIGGIYRGLGDYKRSAGLLESSLRMRRQILGNTHPEVAETIHELASVLTIMSDRKRAEPLFMEGLAIRRAAFGENHSSVAVTLHGLGEVHYWNGDHAKAVAVMSQADSVHRRAGSDSLLMAANLVDLAEALRALHRYSEAEPILREGLAMRRARLGNDHPLTAASMSVLATLLRDQGNIAAAEPLYREALAVRSKVLGEQHPDYAKSLIGLAYSLDRQKKYNQAEPLFRQALAINLSKHGPEHPEVGLDMNALAKVLFAQGKVTESEAAYRRSLAVLERTLGREHPRVSMPQVGLGNLLVATGRSTEALPLMRRAEALRMAEFGPKHALTAEGQVALAACLMKLSRFSEAERLLVTADAVFSQATPPDLEKSASARGLLAEVYLALGDKQKAARYSSN